MLSVVTGVNGIGKSTLMKMLVYYFNYNHIANEANKLDYEIELQNDTRRENIILKLIHFDDNVMDLRANNFTLSNYHEEREHKEINFG